MASTGSLPPPPATEGVEEPPMDEDDEDGELGPSMLRNSKDNTRRHVGRCWKENDKGRRRSMKDVLVASCARMHIERLISNVENDVYRVVAASNGGR